MMANPEHVKVVRDGAKAIDQWRKRNPGVRLDLVEADLRNTDLSEADLGDADLTSADLTGAFLAGAYLAAATPSGQETQMNTLTLRMRDKLNA